MTLKVGDMAPNFTLPTDGGEEVSLSTFQGKKVVLYFYPKDNTPGCTIEAIDFRNHGEALQKHNVVTIGVSTDSVASHDKFKANHQLNFILGSDAEKKVSLAYGVFVDKSMFGKKYKGIDRSTFLIDEKGRIQHIWRSVKVQSHVEDVLKKVKEMGVQ